MLSSARDSHLGLVLELALALHSQRAVKNSGRELEAVVHRLDVRVRKAADVKENIRHNCETHVHEHTYTNKKCQVPDKNYRY